MDLPRGYRKIIKCPVCGQEYNNMKEINWKTDPIKQENCVWGIAICDKCSQKFRVEKRKIIIYTTNKE